MTDTQGGEAATVETTVRWFPPPSGGGLDLHFLSDGRVMVETIDPAIMGGAAATLYERRDGKWVADNIVDWPEMKPHFDKAKGGPR